MSNFKKYTSAIIQNNGTAINGLLNTDLFNTTENKQVFFGLSDIDGNFNNKLGNNSFTLNSNVSGCTATISDGASGEDSTTVRSIYLNIPATSNSRTITFSYDNKILFSIQQTVPKKQADIMFTYRQEGSRKVLYGCYLVKNYYSSSPVGNTIVITVNIINDSTGKGRFEDLSMTLGESSQNYTTYTCDIRPGELFNFDSENDTYEKNGWTYNITIQ